MHLDEDQAGSTTVLPSAAPNPSISARSRLYFWRSPVDQPRWARPALLVTAAVATFAYAWGNTSVNIETYYGAAVRSMSESWHNFFFASFDPWGTVTIDKLPGGLWVQALSLRIFGFHLWSILVPQVIEGTLTVFILYRVVRRVAGPTAGLVAAAALALSPITVLMNRGNVSDTLLLLLLVLAADAMTSAIGSGRWRTLVVAGLLVGLAFQAKMLEAWLVLPAFAIAYVLAAPAASLYRRLGHVVLMGLAAVAVSLSWMTAVALVPAHDRPFVDGSCNNSIYSQVFLYNAGDRISGHLLDHAGCHPPSPSLVAAQAHGTAAGTGKSVIPGGAGRFLTGGLGRDDAWFFVPSIIAFVSLLVLRRREPRTDQLRAAAVLWLTWLFFMWSFFSSSHSLNSYYLAALVPPMAALCGMGFAQAQRLWATSARARQLLMATVVIVSLYAIALVPRTAGLRPWIVGTTGLVGLAALFVVARTGRGEPSGRWGVAGAVMCGAVLLVGPGWASATAVHDGLGPFSTPYQPASLTAALGASADRALSRASELNHMAARFKPSVAVETRESAPAVSLEILMTGHEYLPIGGFSGRVPTPTLSQFIDDVGDGKVRLVLVAIHPLTNSTDLLWVRDHCQARGATFTNDGVDSMRYTCAPRDATGGS
jgi:4-amino-4-deoxy-L-arabinose transferase-like glycosyltransferase